MALDKLYEQSAAAIVRTRIAEADAAARRGAFLPDAPFGGNRMRERFGKGQ